MNKINELFNGKVKVVNTGNFPRSKQASKTRVHPYRLETSSWWRP